MKRSLSAYWQRLNTRYSCEQVFYMMLHWIFVVYQGVRSEKWEKEFSFYRKGLIPLLNGVEDYLLRESAVRFGERINWEALEEAEEDRKCLEDFGMDIARYFRIQRKGADSKALQEGQLLDRLDSLTDILFELWGSNGGYGNTPKSIQDALCLIFQNMQVSIIGDLCCGSGCLGMRVWEHLSQRENTSYYGNDIEPVMCEIAKLMAYFHGIPVSRIMWKDVLATEQKEEKKRYDLMVSDLPKGNNANVSVDPSDIRFAWVGKRNIFSEWMYLLDMLYYLDEGGRGAAVVTTGALIRQSEADIRRRLLQQDWIEAVITLPPNLYPNSRTTTEIIVFNKKKEPTRQNKVLFLDISTMHSRESRNCYTITPQGLQLLEQCMNQYVAAEGTSCICNTEEIEDGTYSLKPVRYIARPEVAVSNGKWILLQNVAKIFRGVQLKKEEEQRLCQDGDAYYLNIKDLVDGRICFSKAQKIRAKDSSWYQKFQIKTDDILITSKGTAFKAAIVEGTPPQAYISGNLTLIRVDKEKYHPHVLYEYLCSRQGEIAIERIQSGSTIRVLNNANLLRLPIPDYNLELMDKVGRQLQSKYERYYKEMERLQAEYHKEKRLLLELIDLEGGTEHGKDIYQP